MGGEGEQSRYVSRGFPHRALPQYMSSEGRAAYSIHVLNSASSMHGANKMIDNYNEGFY